MSKIHPQNIKLLTKTYIVDTENDNLKLSDCESTQDKEDLGGEKLANERNKFKVFILDLETPN